MRLDLLEEAGGDEQLAKFVLGLLPPDAREQWISELARDNVLLAARCASSCFVDVDGLDEIVDAAARDQTPATLLALVEIGRIEKAWGRFLEIENPTNAQVGALNQALSYDDARRAGEFFVRLPLESKSDIRRIAPVIRAIDSQLVSAAAVRNWLVAVARLFVATHRYTELKSIARKCPDALATALDGDVPSFVNRLVRGREHLENKHQRVGLALVLLRQYGLSDAGWSRQIAEVILADNASAPALPTRSKLLGVARSLLRECVLDDGERSKFIKILISSPGIESLELAADVAGEFGDTYRDILRDGVLGFTREGMKDSDPNRVKGLLRKLDLVESVPGSEHLGEPVEGRILRIQDGFAELALAGCKYAGRIDLRNSGDRGVRPNDLIRGVVSRVRDGQLYVSLERPRKK